ncbi:hypothetical protein [Streptomyces sp. enrichment culture]|uniref:hypothetical protein n=1 Tax=Streptomyces sp. enrichment culture TaxID=1795815 RepID=UPI003F57D35F
MKRDAATCGGCLVSAVGVVGAVWVWGASSRTQRHLGQDFEGNGMDLGAFFVELPLVVVGGAVVPGLVYALGAWLLAGRRRPEPARGSEFHA